MAQVYSQNGAEYELTPPVFLSQYKPGLGAPFQSHYYLRPLWGSSSSDFDDPTSPGLFTSLMNQANARPSNLTPAGLSDSQYNYNPYQVGARGSGGINGVPGLNGINGLGGQAGDVGPQGIPGITELGLLDLPQGQTVIGTPGPPGADGEQGEQGPAGEDGADGEQGPQGPQGPAGEDGADGGSIVSGTIIVGLSWDSGDTEGQSQYVVRLDSASYTTVQLGSSVTDGESWEYGGRVYVAQHTFDVEYPSQLPPNEAYWEVSTEVTPKLLAAENLGKSDLRLFLPIFPEGGTIWLNEIDGDYYIWDTGIYLGELDEASNLVDLSTGRLMSVYG